MWVICCVFKWELKFRKARKDKLWRHLIFAEAYQETNLGRQRERHVLPAIAAARE
jgi:hypothetical protein